MRLLVESEAAVRQLVLGCLLLLGAPLLGALGSGKPAVASVAAAGDEVWQVCGGRVLWAGVVGWLGLGLGCTQGCPRPPPADVRQP